MMSTAYGVLVVLGDQYFVLTLMICCWIEKKYNDFNKQSATEASRGATLVRFRLICWLVLWWVMTNSKFRGHHIVFVDDQWLYDDNKQPVAGNERPCGHCEKENTKEGHDGCLGILPNIMNACCGHGNIAEAYVQFDKNKTIRGGDAIAWIEKN